MRFAICVGSPPDPVGLVSMMLEPPLPDLPSPKPENIIAIPGGAMGWAPRPNERALLPRVYSTESGACLVAVGTPIAPGADVKTKLEKAAAEGPDSVIKLAPELDGAFALVYSSPAEDTVTICTDFLGLQPLYWHKGDGFLLVATSAAALARSGLFSATLNPAAWGSLLHYGATFSNATYSNEIERVPPAAAAVWHAREKRLRITEKPWWPAVDPRLTPERFDTGAVVDAFRAEIDAYREWYPSPTLLLSGGGDSRFILALLSRTGCENAITVEHPDVLLNANGRFANAIGKAFVRKYEQIPADRDYFSSQQYFDFLQLHEIAAPSAELFIANLFPAVRSHRAPAYWDGLMPHIHAFPVATGENESLDEFTGRVSQKPDSDNVQAAAPLFRRPADIIDGFHSELAKVKQRYANDREEIARFFVQNRTRNRVSKMPLQVMSAFGQALIPGISKAAFSSILTLPVKHRQNHALYSLIFEQHFPEFLAYPLVSRGEFRKSSRTSLSWSLFASLATVYQGSLLQRVIAKTGQDPGEYFRRSTLVDRVIATVDPGHPDLNPDAVKALTSLRGKDAKRWRPWYAKQFLFYWKIWRDQMEGNSARMRGELFGID